MTLPEPNDYELNDPQSNDLYGDYLSADEEITPSMEYRDTSDDGVPLLTDDAVLRHLDTMITRDDRRTRSIWTLVLDANAVAVPLVIPIDGLPARPDDTPLANLFRVVEEAMRVTGAVDDLAGSDCSVVLGLTRPGPEAFQPADREWAAALREAAATTGIRLRLIAVLTRTSVRPITLDDAI